MKTFASEDADGLKRPVVTHSSDGIDSAHVINEAPVKAKGVAHVWDTSRHEMASLERAGEVTALPRAFEIVAIGDNKEINIGSLKPSVTTEGVKHIGISKNEEIPVGGIFCSSVCTAPKEPNLGDVNKCRSDGIEVCLDLRYNCHLICHENFGAVEYRGIQFVDKADGSKFAILAQWPAVTSPANIGLWLKELANKCCN